MKTLEKYEQVYKDLKIIEQAKKFAYWAHSQESQRYGIYSYSKHLEDVARILYIYGYTSKKYIVPAFLHDVIEDTNIDSSDIEILFGKKIAQTVLSLTNRPNGTPNYTVLKENSIGKAIKLADTISNIYQGLTEQSYKPTKYIRRMPEFKRRLYQEGQHEILWQCLENAIRNYQSGIIPTL